MKAIVLSSQSLISRSVEETEAHGVSVGAEATLGWVIGLSGDLGSGKTAWVRGFVRGLGCTVRVHSPTFALLNEYSGGRWPIFHLDLYRLENTRQWESAGLDSYLIDPAGITVVEWVDRWERMGGRIWRRITLLGDAEDESRRTIIYDYPGT